MNKEFPPFTQILQVKILRIFMIKGRAIRKLVWERGGGGERGRRTTKKKTQGKIKLKKKKKKKTSIQARRVTLKNIHAKA